MKSVLFYMVVCILAVSCGKGTDNTPADPGPQNLSLAALVAADNSGNVDFTATATNAVSYEFDFGNGVYQTDADGKLTYDYPASGTYTATVTAKSSSGITASKSVSFTVTVVLALVWSDEFDTPGTPDPAKWGYDIGTGANGWGNNELQYYTSRPENAAVSSGTLKITATRENYSGSPFTSARLLTKDKFSFKYGKVELSAKLPAGAGTWPAAWMLGGNFATAGWPACGEIDIMEHKGSTPDKIYGTVHYPGFSGGNAQGGTTLINNATTAFHKYTMEWTPASIKFSVDDVVFYTFANQSTYPFNQTFFLILNVAIGGNFGGSVDPLFSSAKMEVDWIRVYQ